MSSRASANMEIEIFLVGLSVKYIVVESGDFACAKVTAFFAVVEISFY